MPRPMGELPASPIVPAATSTLRGQAGVAAISAARVPPPKAAVLVIVRWRPR